jgi:hypothetical protein
VFSNLYPRVPLGVSLGLVWASAAARQCWRIKVRGTVVALAEKWSLS